jgi:hypothetical protein
MNLAAVLSSLEATGIAAYQVSSGAPVSVTSVGGVPVISTGAAATATAYLPIILIIGAVILLIVLL